MGINRRYIYLSTVHSRRIVAAGAQRRYAAPMPWREVRLSSSVLRSFPFCYPVSLFFFFRRRRPNRDIFRSGIISRPSRFFSGCNAPPRPRHRCVALRRVVEHRRFLSIYLAAGECLTNPYPYASSASRGFFQTAGTSHGSIRYDGEATYLNPWINFAAIALSVSYN